MFPLQDLPLVSVGVDGLQPASQAVLSLKPQRGEQLVVTPQVAQCDLIDVEDLELEELLQFHRKLPGDLVGVFEGGPQDNLEVADASLFKTEKVVME